MKQAILDQAEEIAAVATRRTCPQCQGAQIVRSRRRGLLEWLLRAIRLYPFRCDTCSYRFVRFAWRGR